MKAFDEKYYFGNSKTRKQIYALAKKQENNVEKIAEKKKIICVSLTYLYCAILKEFGIEATASMPDEAGHIYPIIRINNQKTFIADVQMDLENIQTKTRLKHFEYMKDLSREEGTTVNNQEELTKMLIEIGYIKDKSDYKNEKIKKLKSKVKDKNPHEALRIILEEEDLYDGNQEMESVEIDKFYKRALEKIIPHFFGKKVFAFNCCREKEGKQKEYTLCIFSEEDTIKSYLYSRKDRRFLRVEISKMKQLEKEGLNLGINIKENGVRKLKKYINKVVENEQTK